MGFKSYKTQVMEKKDQFYQFFPKPFLIYFIENLHHPVTEKTKQPEVINH